MDGIEILTWIAAFVFVILGMGLPETDELGPGRESGSENDETVFGDDD